MKAFLFVLIVVVPAIIIGISNFFVFPDAAWAATLMLVVAVGVTAVFAYHSGNATLRISRYCIFGTIGLAVILAVNLAGHWILSREVSAATKGVAERHTEEDRESKRLAELADNRQKVAQAEKDLADAQARAANAERRRLAQLPISERRAIIQPSKPEPAPAIKIAPMGFQPQAASVSAMPAGPRLSPEQVRNKWWWFLTALAIAECGGAILGGAVLGAVWEWDRNRNGIADHRESQPIRP